MNQIYIQPRPEKRTIYFEVFLHQEISFNMNDQVSIQKIMKEVPMEFFEKTITAFLFSVESETYGTRKGYKFYMPEYIWRAFLDHYMRFVNHYDYQDFNNRMFRGWKIEFGYENKLIVVHDNYAFTGIGYWEAPVKFA